MNQVKPSGGGGRDAPIEDATQIRAALADLKASDLEFPIRVEGTHTLPYTSHLRHIDLEKGLLHLKLIRPLPHELAPGASFVMLFAKGDQRLEAPLTFLGRESYLLYRFTIPVRMTLSDRRKHKRFPFRPREKAYVLAQVGGLPQHGLAGPLVNLSEEGLAFRVDRVMRLDDNIRVTPPPGFFERGRALPTLKIRDLPKLPVLEARGHLTYSLERGGGIIVGVRFGGLQESEAKAVQSVLIIRDNMQRASSVGGDGPRDSGSKAPAESKSPAARTSPSGTQTPDALLLLGRRSLRVLLGMAPGLDRDQVQQALGAAGFLRVETVDSPELALAELRTEQGPLLPLLVLEQLPGEDPSPAGIRSLQQELGATRELAVALISREAVVPDSGDSLIRTVPWPTSDDLAWLPLLDELAGLG